MAAQETRGECAQESTIPCLEGERHLEARFECPICLQCLSEPVLTPCGHRFCNTCIHKWLQREGGVCPVDNQPLDSKDLFPDNFTRREIHELDRKNGQDGGESGSRMVECTFREVGCLAAVHPDEMAAHLDTQIHYHTGLLSTAYSKLQVSVQGQNVYTKAQEASNLWEPDNKGQLQQNGDVHQSWQGLLRSLYERIVMLEQRNREQDIQLENMKRQFTNVDCVAHDLALRYCNGTYLWTVTQVSSKLTAMAANPTRCMYYSPGFYTAPNGYRFCARLNLSPNDRTHVALHIHLMRTDHDDSLLWPFTGRITFMLVNPKDSSQHVCDTMMSRPELVAFKRPMKDMNPRGFGYTEFISVHDLSVRGFVTPSDSLLIKLHIISV